MIHNLSVDVIRTAIFQMLSTRDQATASRFRSTREINTFVAELKIENDNNKMISKVKVK